VNTILDGCGLSQLFIVITLSNRQKSRKATVVCRQNRLVTTCLAVGGWLKNLFEVRIFVAYVSNVTQHNIAESYINLQHSCWYIGQRTLFLLQVVPAVRYSQQQGRHATLMMHGLAPLTM
jgi:hypothetical protein